MNMMRVGRMSRQRYKRRANALSALGDTIAAVQTIFGPVLPHQAIAALVEAEPHLSKYGITVIANGHAWHLHEDWPGMDRRKVSGSLWDGRQSMSSARWAGKARCAHTTWKAAAQQSASWRGMQLFRHGGMGAAWLDAGPAGDALRLLRAAALDRGAPVPLCAQQERLTGRSSQNRSFLVERGVAYPGAAIGCGGATSGDKQSVTKAMAAHNAGICRERDADAELIAWCDERERELYSGVVNGRHLFGVPRSHWDILIDRLMNPRGQGKPRVLGAVMIDEVADPECAVFDPAEWARATSMRADDVSWSHTRPMRCSGKAVSPVLRQWSGYRKARTAALLLNVTDKIANRPAFSDRVIPSSPEYRTRLGEVGQVRIIVKERSGRPRPIKINRVPGPHVRIITADKPGALFGMRKADMAAAARVMGRDARPDLYWPPLRSIPNASSRHEIFVMKAAKSVQEYAKAA
jgi:hypothetical protein